jgi:hypothetical protein
MHTKTKNTIKRRKTKILNNFGPLTLSWKSKWKELQVIKGFLDQKSVLFFFFSLNSIKTHQSLELNSNIKWPGVKK